MTTPELKLLLLLRELIEWEDTSPLSPQQRFERAQAWERARELAQQYEARERALRG